MIKIDHLVLRAYVTSLFLAGGASAENAAIVANSLVLANLAGHDSHGVIRTNMYLEQVAVGNLDPIATPTIASQSGATAQVNGNHGFGQVISKFSVELAIEMARAHGIAAVAHHNSYHVGRVGEWVLKAADENMAAIAFCNVASRRPWVTPHGGVGRLLGTNPFAAAVPMAGRPPYLLDFATSVVAEGKVKVAKVAGKQLPDGWILDSDGKASTEPDDLYAEGMLRPAGAYKGFGLGMLTELLGGVLTGSGWPELPEPLRLQNGVLYIVLDIDRFRPILPFLNDAESLYKAAKAIRPEDGFDEVLVPGEPELISAEKRRRDGIPIDDAAWEQIAEAAAALGVTIPAI